MPAEQQEVRKTTSKGRAVSRYTLVVTFKVPQVLDGGLLREGYTWRGDDEYNFRLRAGANVRNELNAIFLKVKEVHKRQARLRVFDNTRPSPENVMLDIVDGIVTSYLNLPYSAQEWLYKHGIMDQDTAERFKRANL